MTKLTYQIDEAEFMHAVRAYWSHQKIGDRGNWLLAAFSSIAGLGLIINGIAEGWIFVSATVVFIVLTVLRNLIWRYSYKRMVKYSAPITASFLPDTVQTSSAEGQSTLPWSSFTEFAETPDFFFLMVPQRGLSIIPKRACKDKYDVDVLREIIAANLPPAKRRWI